MYLQITSFTFLFIVIISLPIYWILKNKTRLQNIFLLILSYIIYCWITIWLGIILFISTVVNYTTGILIGKINKVKLRKTTLYSAIIYNIAYLGVFRYFNFFSTEIANFLNLFGFSVSPYLIIFIIPIGISYYTLSAISYNVDVYKKEIEVTKDFITFAIFLVYFPKMIAGPIERPKNLIPQITKNRILTKKDFSGAMQLILIGLFKKVVIADFLNKFIHNLYENPKRFSNEEALIIMWLFIIQLYADFSGYTNMVQGISKLFGINLGINFNQPFLSFNISDMWRRWHISLTGWLRDYLYIPLGGNRKSFGRISLNIMIIFLISGLWHGPYINWIIWGGINGIYVVLHRIYRTLMENCSFYRKMKNLDKSYAPRKHVIIRYLYLFLAWLLSFNIFAFSFIFFAAQDFRIAVRIVKMVLSFKYDFSYEGDLYVLIYLLIFSSFFIFLFDFIQRKLKTDAIFTNLHWFLQVLCYLFLIIMIIIFQSTVQQAPFIYEGY